MATIREEIELAFKEEWAKGVINENPINKSYILLGIRDILIDYKITNEHKVIHRFVMQLYIREINKMIKELNSEIFK